MQLRRLAVDPIRLKRRDTSVLTTDDIIGEKGAISVSFTRLPKVVRLRNSLYQRRLCSNLRFKNSGK